ncbi:MAG TPA: exodeoxyribonuclease V subunit gamma [Parachlamydiaceae bacterium]|nr:exodeoxyribonuclease V subunit gamma [Parachlamydiaceae bacterium]
MHIFFSNQIEELYQELKKSLFAKGSKNVFAKRLVIVPSQAIKSWLMLQMAKDEDLMVAMGVEIMHLERAVEKIILKKRFPSFLEVSLTILSEAKKMALEESAKWKKLSDYLQISNETKEFSLKSERRLFALSLKLKYLFSRYGTYCREMVFNWEKEDDSSDFQKEIWNRLFLNGKWSYLAKEFFHHTFTNEDMEDLQEENLQIHLFSINFLPKEYYKFFEKISSVIPFNYYFLSPCLAFWSDLQSEKEYYALKNYVQKCGKKGENLKIDEHMREENPLLANFGKLGREMAKLIEESSAFSSSSYIVSEGVIDLLQYEDFLFEDISLQKEEFTLLKAIQADLAFLRNPTFSEKIAVEDDSLQFHAAVSPLREVQILYDNLIHLMKDNSFGLSDVIVMAPDISIYEPFIRAVFGSLESVIPFHVMDLSTPSKNALVQEFLHLLSLASCRIQTESLIELFKGRHFQKAQGLRQEDIEKIEKWLLESDFRWAIDEEERHIDLKENHCPYQIAGKSKRGTLNQSISRLLASLVLEPSKDELLNAQFEEMPLFCIQPSDALLLGKFASLVSSLKEDLRNLSNASKMCMQDWVSYFHCLAKAYFGLDEAFEFLSDDEMMLLDQFEELQKVSHLFHEELFSFYTIKKTFEEILKKEKLEFEGNQLNAISFCSMLPMRSLPAKIIALMGMNDGDFPRAAVLDSLDLASKNNSDYIPSQTDFDRYLFLETLLSARQYLLISYVENPDSKSSSMSLAVQELLNYVEAFYLVKNRPNGLLQRHPYHAFHHSYFQKNSPFKSYSEFNFQLGCQFYKKEKKKPHAFINSFEAKRLSEFQEKELLLNLKDLSDFSKNPLKIYFNKKLGIYLKAKSEKFKEDEDFVLSPLQLSEIKKKLLRMNADEAIHLAEKKELLPDGFFNQVAKEKIEEEALFLRKCLSLHSISSSDCFRIDLEEGLKEARQDEDGNWKVPALEIACQDRQIKIVGSFLNVSSKGLLVHAKFSKEDIVKVWPDFLVFTAVMNLHPIAQKEIIFLKCGKSRSAFFDAPLKYLEDYLSYYFKGLENASPLIPEWVSHFIYEEKEDLSEKIENSLNQDFHPLYNDYLHWLKNETEKFSCKSFSKEWKEEASLLFLEPYEKWHEKGRDK